MLPYKFRGVSKTSLRTNRPIARAINTLIAIVLAGIISLSLDQGTVVHADSFTVPDGDIAALAVALDEANTNGVADTINLSLNGTYTLASSTPILITSEITIEGNGATLTRDNSSGSLQFRIIKVSSGGVLILNDIVITNGDTTDGGGGILNSGGSVTLNDSLVQDNDAIYYGGGIRNEVNSTFVINSSIVQSNFSANGGGGIFNAGSLTISNSNITGNWANSTGGGIDNRGGTVNLVDTTLSSNTSANFGGGGINTRSGGVLNITGSTLNGNSAQGVSGGGGAVDSNNSTVTIVNSTVSNNSTNGYPGGGGILNSVNADLDVANSTITANTSSSHGAGGIHNLNLGNVSLGNTILASNNGAGTGHDCQGAVQSQGNNLIGDDSGCNFAAQSGDQVGTSGNVILPLIGPLQHNGGLTETHELLFGSPAINMGSNPICAPADQRGISRPQTATCDIGAYELEFDPTQADLSLTIDDSPDPSSVGDSLVYTITVMNNGPATSTSVALINDLPTHTTFGSSSTSHGVCNETGSTVTCDIGDLLPHEQATLEITVEPTKNGIQVNNANVSSTEIDPDTSNNSAIVETLVHPSCNGLAATIVGTSGNDVLTGTLGNDVILGLEGNDVIYGLDGDDTICGGAGEDAIYGGTGNDHLKGGGGKDIISGGHGDDNLSSSSGDNVLLGRSGNDEFRCGSGFDIVEGGKDTDTVVGSNCDIVVGVP